MLSGWPGFFPRDQPYRRKPHWMRWGVLSGHRDPHFRFLHLKWVGSAQLVADNARAVIRFVRLKLLSGRDWRALDLAGYRIAFCNGAVLWPRKAREHRAG